MRKNKSKKALTDLRRRTQRIKEIDFYDLVHDDVATEEVRLASSPRSKAKSLRPPDSVKANRMAVEYGFNALRVSPATPSPDAEITPAWPYRLTRPGRSESPSVASSAKRRQGSNSSNAKHASHLANALPLLHISQAPAQQSQLAHSSPAAPGASLADRTPIVSATAGMKIDPSDHDFALGPPSADVSAGAMHLSPLFGGIPNAYGTHEDLDSFTL